MTGVASVFDDIPEPTADELRELEEEDLLIDIDFGLDLDDDHDPGDDLIYDQEMIDSY